MNLQTLGSHCNIRPEMTQDKAHLHLDFIRANMVKTVDNLRSWKREEEVGLFDRRALIKTTEGSLRNRSSYPELKFSEEEKEPCIRTVYIF